MKKVLFLMVLLFLFLVTVNVKAQVRIGGNTPPSAAAVLDLNASDAANLATGGLVLPRVDLKTNVMQLTNGVANQTGTMVYNVTTTLGRIGVYYWNGNNWVLASLPSTSSVDSGRVLVMTPAGPAWGSLFAFTATVFSNTSLVANPTVAPAAWEITFNHPALNSGIIYRVSAPGRVGWELCSHSNGLNYTVLIAEPDAVGILPLRDLGAETSAKIRCYRFS